MNKNLTLAIATIFLTSLTAFSGTAHAFTEDERKQLTIGSVEVQDLTSQYPQGPSARQLYEAAPQYENLGGAIATLTQAEVIVDRIINIGTKIWNVVERGRPVANYQNNRATALPQGARAWDQLENWQRPTSRVVGITYKNLYGIEVAKMVYRIVLLAGGSVEGRGRYIGYASVEPLEVNTAFMYTMNASANADSVFNLGTRQNPVGGMILNISWTVSTVLMQRTGTATFTLDGNGGIRDTGGSNPLR